jgi:hypothetical protein
MQASSELFGAIAAKSWIRAGRTATHQNTHLPRGQTIGRSDYSWKKDKLRRSQWDSEAIRAMHEASLESIATVFAKINGVPTTLRIQSV